ncbi:MAG: MgtC/SapB family protein [Acidobacteriota bacterium]|nr:MgtC/SapB family protein [Acidobacteriota bacterium]
MNDFFPSLLPELVILGQVIIALLLGGVIGLERELADKPAGIRTHMLVGAASSLLVGLSELMIQQAHGSSWDLIQADPLRVLEAVVTGVAVLGAGTILRPQDANRVEGLTTAASLFFTAGIGIACALDQYLTAVGATVLIWLTLRVLGRIEAEHVEPQADSED